MYAKKIKYNDYNGNKREETFHFNLSEAELTEMQLSCEGGLDGIIKKIVETKSLPELIKLFKTIILKSYGELSNDGKYFRKRDSVRGEYVDDFIATEAYSVLFTELATDDKVASEFLNGIIPKKLVAEANKTNSPSIEMS